MPLKPHRVYMLAADHRWQWEEFCDAHSVARVRIPDVKAVIVDAFYLARERSSDVARDGSLLLDPQYSAAQITRARADGILVGTPAERAGAFPLEWPSAMPFAAAPAGGFVKVLVKDRADYGEALRTGQFDKLADLQLWCRSHTTSLVIEILVPRQDEPERLFEEEQRPAMLAATIRDAYARRIEPEFWKIEGTTSTRGGAIVDGAIAERGGCRQIILGKGAAVDVIARWFAVAASCPTAAGFAIGRSVFWTPGTAFLRGEIDARTASERLAEAYLSLVATWRAARADT